MAIALMSQHAAFRRIPVNPQAAQNLRTRTLPAPMRGIIQHENEAFMQPGGAVVCDNWVPTMRGVKLLGGCKRWCDLHALDAPAWANAHAYTVGNQAYDGADGTIWQCAVAHTSAATPTTFAQDRAAHPGPPAYWTAVTFTRKSVVSAFEYVSGSQQRMFAGQETKLFDVTANVPTLVKTGQTSGNYSASQLSVGGNNWLIAVNETGDYPLRFNGSSWVVLDGTSTPADGASNIKGPGGSLPAPGLTTVQKYRNRLFFTGVKSMSLWYLGTNSVGGDLTEIPLSGAATKGGYLLFTAVWSIDAGDGTDDKLAVVTSEGEILIFSGSDPSTPATWSQEGRYHVSPPLGINAWANVGGDLLILTVDGIVPISQAITKSAGELELALITRPIKPMWRSEVSAKRALPWTIKKWDEYGGNFVTFPGGPPGSRYCLVFNNATGAFGRCVGYDAMCFIRMGTNMFFGTQDGIIMRANDGGKMDGLPYVASLVGSWEMFGAPSSQFIWHQARAVFHSAQDFNPQLAAAIDYQTEFPPPPEVGVEPDAPGVWDDSLWDHSLWDNQPLDVSLQPVHTTMWVSIGMTGYAHAPIVQASISQAATPIVELIAISATYEPAGVNVD